MPHINIRLDVDMSGFDALAGIENAAEGIAAGRVIHISDNANVEIGTLRHGMESGKDSVAICFPLPDGRVVLLETSAQLFIAAAQAITAWQKGRRDRGED